MNLEAEIDKFRQTLRDDVVSAMAEKIEQLLAENKQPGLVDRERMAELLTVSVPKLDTMVRNREIPSKLIGTRRLFDPAAVIDALPDAN